MQSAHATLRAQVVTFLNARPLYHSLLDPAAAPLHSDGTPMFSVETALPSACARALASGDCDLALLPVAALADHPEWEVVPGIGIGCRGPVETVVLASHKTLDQLTVIALDSASQTSIALLKLILAWKGLSPELVRVAHDQISAGIEDTRGALIIGDAAFGARERFAHVLDLGQIWFETTGLPFVFAVWAARPGVLTPAHAQALRSARDRSVGKYAEQIAAEYFDGLSKPLFDIAHYSNYLRKTIRYGLETQQREGLAEFLDQARKRGILDIVGLRDDDEISLELVGEATPAQLERARRRRAEAMDTDELLARAASGERLDLAEGIFLYERAPLLELGQAAHERRLALHPERRVTYIVDRNVNYANECVTRCKFCNFYVPPGARSAYVLSRRELTQKFRETEALDGIQILLQGGLNPELRIEWYEDLFRWTKQHFDLNLHALSPTEIVHIAQIEDMSIHRVLERLHAAGMDSLPGGGAEILDDEVRQRISPFKTTTEEWLEVMRQAHALGMRSSASMVFGFQETSEQILLHFERIRALQDETGGFIAFVSWPFQADGTRLKLRDDTSANRYLRIQALARLYLDNVPNLQVSWPTLGPEIGEVGLHFGANDFGSIMIEENVVSQAGAHFQLDTSGIERHIRMAGFEPARRNSSYEIVQPRHDRVPVPPPSEDPALLALR